MSQPRPKYSQVDNDLMEIECALAIARSGGEPNWATALEALTRLFDFKEKLPSSYKPHF